MSVQASDRKLDFWYNRIQNGEIKLPRFQRFEAWDRNRICSLLNTIIHDLPLGITLILEVDQEQFISRYLVTAEQNPPFPRVIEHLLDGQQRLTALWRVLHNNYETEKYFLYVKAYDKVWDWGNDEEGGDDETEANERVLCQSRWIGRKKKRRMPLWADEPEESLKRGCIPMDLLRPEEISNEINKWVDTALESQKPATGVEDFEMLFEKFYAEKQALLNIINKYRVIVQHYNLPFLALPSNTSKSAALRIFINMNTNSKPLSQYDIIVAEIEGLKDTSLHALQEELDFAHPTVKRYFDLSYLILYTSALMQEKTPNNVGIWDMDKKRLVDNWDTMVKGLVRMTSFLESQKIYDEQRLPTNAVLAVIAAILTHIPESGDKAGQATILLKKYLWSSFFTDRYENAAASRAYADYMALLGILLDRKKANTNIAYTENDVPVLNRNIFPLATEEQLMNISWPKSQNIRGRGILAVANYFGASDFADGAALTPDNVKVREYHHIFPDALLAEAKKVYGDEIESFLSLNCALITNTTNRVIGRKEPLTYLKERYNWADENIVKQRLNSHLIPIQELAAGTYDGLNKEKKAEKILTDFKTFIQRRSSMIINAVGKLTNGEDVFLTEELLGS